MAFPSPANASTVTRYQSEALFEDGYIFSEVTITETPHRNGRYTCVVRYTDWAYYYGGPFDGRTTGTRRVGVYRFYENWDTERSIRRYRDVITVGDMACVVCHQVVWTGETLVLDKHRVSAADPAPDESGAEQLRLLARTGREHHDGVCTRAGHLLHLVAGEKCHHCVTLDPTVTDLGASRDAVDRDPVGCAGAAEAKLRISFGDPAVLVGPALQPTEGHDRLPLWLGHPWAP